MKCKCDTKNVCIFNLRGTYYATINHCKGHRTKSDPQFTLCKVEDGKELSKEELYVIFFEKLEKGELVTRYGGVLKQNEDLTYRIDNSNSFAEGIFIRPCDNSDDSNRLVVKYIGEDTGYHSLTYDKSIFDPKYSNAKITQKLTNYISVDGMKIQKVKKGIWKAVPAEESEPIKDTRTPEQIAVDLGLTKKEVTDSVPEGLAADYEDIMKKMMDPYRKENTREPEVAPTPDTSIQEVHTASKVDKIICDPADMDAQKLVGKTVLASKYFNFKYSVRVVLQRICETEPEPFTCSDNGTYSFIKACPEPTIKAYNLNDINVRNSMRGKWFKSKKDDKECMVYSFSFNNGWRVNGLTAQVLLSDYVWMDGSPMGDMIE